MCLLEANLDLNWPMQGVTFDVNTVSVYNWLEQGQAQFKVFFANFFLKNGPLNGLQRASIAKYVYCTARK